jgi:hypothetical protein
MLAVPAVPRAVSRGRGAQAAESHRSHSQRRASSSSAHGHTPSRALASRSRGRTPAPVYEPTYQYGYDDDFDDDEYNDSSYDPLPAVHGAMKPARGPGGVPSRSVSVPPQRAAAPRPPATPRRVAAPRRRSRTQASARAGAPSPRIPPSLAAAVYSRPGAAAPRQDWVSKAAVDMPPRLQKLLDQFMAR